MRYVMRIAELSESSNLWTQIALLGITLGARFSEYRFYLFSPAYVFYIL